MKCALVDRAVAEKTKRDPVFVSIFAGKGKTARQRHVGPDDGVPAVHVSPFIKVMHRTTEAAGAAGLLPEKLRHACVGAGSARKRVGVIAISGDDVIVIARGRNRADHNCLLSNVEMTKPADL